MLSTYISSFIQGMSQRYESVKVYSQFWNDFFVLINQLKNYVVVVIQTLLVFEKLALILSVLSWLLPNHSMY